MHRPSFGLSALCVRLSLLLLALCGSLGHAQQIPLDQLKQNAAKGDAEAEFELGKAYAKGSGTTVDFVQARQWYTKAAHHGNGKAMNNLGSLYKDGKGTKANGIEAAKWFKKAASLGLVLSEFNLGALYLDGAPGVPKDPQKAVSWFQKARSHGDINASTELGKIYLYGNKGVEKNPPEAFKYMSEAAVKGDLWAQNSVGTMYEAGVGTKLDTAKAVAWYQRAADAGNFEAQSNLGRAYCFGTGGLTRDPFKGFTWLIIAQLHGDKTASHVMEDDRGSVTPEQLAEAHRLALEFQPKQTTLGDIP